MNFKIIIVPLSLSSLSSPRRCLNHRRGYRHHCRHRYHCRYHRRHHHHHVFVIFVTVVVVVVVMVMVLVMIMVVVWVCHCDPRGPQTEHCPQDVETPMRVTLPSYRTLEGHCTTHR